MLALVKENGETGTGLRTPPLWANVCMRKCHCRGKWGLVATRQHIWIKYAK